jgi:hypothetical protein
MKKKLQKGGTAAPRDTRGEALTRSSVTAESLLKGATGKDSFTEDDIRNLAVKQGYSQRDVNSIVKGFGQAQGKSIEFMGNMKDFNVFDTKGGAVASGKKTGNKKGFDAGDLIGLGSNVNRFAGFAAGLKPQEKAIIPTQTKSEEPTQTKSQDQPWLKMEGSQPVGTAAQRLANEKFSWENQPTTESDSGNSDIPQSLTKTTNQDPIKMINSPADLLTFGGNRAAGYDYDSADAIFRDASTLKSAREQTEVYSPEQHKILWDHFRKLRSNNINVNPKEVADLYRQFGNQLFTDAALTMLTSGLGAEYAAAKYATNPLAQNTLKFGLPSLPTAPRWAQSAVNYGKNVVKDIAKKMNVQNVNLPKPVNINPGPTIPAENSFMSRAANWVKGEKPVINYNKIMEKGQAAKDAVANWLKSPDPKQLKNGGKLYGQGGLKVPNPKIQKVVNAASLIGLDQANVFDPNYKVDIDWDSIPKEVADTYVKPSEKSTRTTAGARGEAPAIGDALGNATKYALPFIGEAIARKQLDRLKPIQFKPAELMTGVVQDMPRNYRPMLNRVENRGSDLLTNIAGQKFTDAYNRDKEFQWDLQNQMSKMQQRENILNRTNQGTMFNAQREQQIDLANAQMNAGLAGIRYQSVRDPFIAAQQHLAGDRASNAYTNSSERAALYETMVKNPEAYGGINNEAYQAKLRELEAQKRGGFFGKKGMKFKIK